MAQLPIVLTCGSFFECMCSRERERKGEGGGFQETVYLWVNHYTNTSTKSVRILDKHEENTKCHGHRVSSM